MTKKPDKESSCQERDRPLSRRKFIGAGLAATATVAIGNSAAGVEEAQAGYGAQTERSRQGRKYRRDSGKEDYPASRKRHIRNRDEKRFGVIASFTKGLQHDQLGEASEKDYRRLVRLIKDEDFNKIDNLDIGIRALKNPQAGVAFGLDGVDPQSVTMRPAPDFDSAEVAAEMTELYWQATLREVHFSDYATDSLVGGAGSELTGMSDFRGPKENGVVTSGTLFRGSTPGDLMGPYVSQFLMQTIPMGSLQVEQAQRTVVPFDYMTTYSDWLEVQNGNLMKVNPSFDGTSRYIRNGRDLAWYVWNDRVYQAYFNAASRLVDKDIITFNLAELKLDAGNPYRKRSGTEGFVTFGDAHIFSLIAKAAFAALKAVWYQKWFVHRRLRPETFGGRVHNHRSGNKEYKIHNELLNATVLDVVFANNGTFLLPQAFIEGSPMHPSYGAGHAAIAGACTTVLKAFFDENIPFPNPVVASADGTALETYTGGDSGFLTVGGELNKLCANIATGRNFAGIHYRSDFANCITLGEKVGIELLRRMGKSFHERHSFHLTKFNGKEIVIKSNGSTAI